MKTVNSEFEKYYASLLVEKNATDDKAFNLLADNPGLITECESLSANVKTLQGAFFELQISFDVLKKSFMVKKNLGLAK